MLRNVCLSFRAIWVTRIGEVSRGRETIVQVLGGRGGRQGQLESGWKRDDGQP